MYLDKRETSEKKTCQRSKSMSDVIVVYNIEPVNKGSLIARCDVTITPWKMNLHGVNIFQKGTQKWLGMPSRQWEKDGETKWLEMISWADAPTAKRFRDQVMEAVDKYLATNPDMKPEPVVKEDDDLPF
jgi:hypothetical protein